MRSCFAFLDTNSLLLLLTLSSGVCLLCFSKHGLRLFFCNGLDVEQYGKCTALIFDRCPPSGLMMCCVAQVRSIVLSLSLDCRAVHSIPIPG